jgi:hypothetical protein
MQRAECRRNVTLAGLETCELTTGFSFRTFRGEGIWGVRRNGKTSYNMDNLRSFPTLWPAAFIVIFRTQRMDNRSVLICI